jgi:putative tryptophan/tyrosine transport system substrate-binding protein
MERAKLSVSVVLIACVLLFVTPLDAQRQIKIPRIGVLSSTPVVESLLLPFRQGLKELGWSEGSNIRIDYRLSDGNPGEYSKLAAELVHLDPELIVVSSTPATQAVKRATRTIPIVMAAVADPVGVGLVASLAYPGGNITGLSMRAPELSTKRLQLLKDVVPGVQRVGILWNPRNDSNRLSWRESQTAAQVLGFQLKSIEVQSAIEFSKGFGTLTAKRADAFTVLRDPFIMRHLKEILRFAHNTRLPAIYESREFVLAGGLMSYAADNADLWKRAAWYVDKILRGAKPADLPVEQTMRAEFIINLNAAKQIGLTIPSEVLQQAHKVIK